MVEYTPENTFYQHRKLRFFVDDEEVSHVARADTGEGYVVAADLDENGKFQLDETGCGIKLVVLTGRIVVIDEPLDG